MTENDVIAVVVAAYVVVHLTTAGLKHRAAQKAADRKAQVKP